MLDGLNIDRVAIELPFWPYEIYWYGIIIVIGIALGVWWAARELKKREQPPRVIDEFYNGVIIVVFAGYLFARLTYVLFDLFGGGSYNSLVEVINIRAGGVNILGGFVGAVLTGWLYIKWRRLPFWQYADVAGPALLLAQAIGRWGNFINQELYGPPTERPWGILIDAPYRLLQYQDLPPDTRFHPTFLYESVMLLIGFFLLAYLNGRYRHIWQPGTLFGFFLIWWGGNRAWIELFRPDQTTLGNTFITYSMLLAMGIALVGVYITLDRNEKKPAILQRSKHKRPAKPKPRRN
jgi:phosphatidylglycerol:prolipoprotein diacylglycerol transferase